MMHNRVVVRLDVERTRTWDHRKLGLPAMELGGSTAASVTGPSGLIDPQFSSRQARTHVPGAYAATVWAASSAYMSSCT